jgi:hypothetical protein
MAQFHAIVLETTELFGTGPIHRRMVIHTFSFIFAMD